MAQVNATSTAIEFVVRGGGLGDDVCVPANVMNVGDKKFIPLSRSDRRLQRYVLGSRPHLGGRSKTAPFDSNSFLAGLSALRNAAVDTLLLKHLQDQDPIVNIDVQQKAARKDIDPAELKPTVTIELPAVYFDMEHEAFALEPNVAACVTDLLKVSVVRIEGNADILHHVRAGMLEAMAPPEARRRRAAPLSQSIGVKGVFADKRRRVVWSWCRVPGEDPVRITKKPDVWETAVVQCAAHALAAQVVVLEAKGGPVSLEEGEDALALEEGEVELALEEGGDEFAVGGA